MKEKGNWKKLVGYICVYIIVVLVSATFLELFFGLGKLVVWVAISIGGSLIFFMLLKRLFKKARKIMKGNELKMENINKLAFIMSNILTFLGIIILVISKIIYAVMFKIGTMMFDIFAKSGSYKPGMYAPDLSGVYIIGVICIIVGLVLSVAFYTESIE